MSHVPNFLAEARALAVTGVCCLVLGTGLVFTAQLSVSEMQEQAKPAEPWQNHYYGAVISIGGRLATVTDGAPDSRAYILYADGGGDRVHWLAVANQVNAAAAQAVANRQLEK